MISDTESFSSVICRQGASSLGVSETSVSANFRFRYSSSRLQEEKYRKKIKGFCLGSAPLILVGRSRESGES